MRSILILADLTEYSENKLCQTMMPKADEPVARTYRDAEDDACMLFGT